MIASSADLHVHRPVPTGGIALGLIILAGVGLPGLLFAPSAQTAIAFSVTTLLSTGLVMLWRIRVECHRAPQARSLRFVAVRWPLRRRERLIPFEAIASVEVQRHNGAEGVVVVLRDGERWGLPGGGSSSAAHQETVRVLRSWLADAEPHRGTLE